MAEGSDLEFKFQAIEEFVVETLSDFNKRLQNTETGIQFSDSTLCLSLLQSCFRPEVIIMAEGSDLECKFQAIGEFVVETLSDFNKRLQNTETGIREKITEELSAFKENASSEIKESVSK